MLVGDKKGMQAPSETSLGESYPLRSEQKSSSQQQRPVINNKSNVGRADPESAERGTVPPGEAAGKQEACQTLVPEQDFGVCNTNSIETAGRLSPL